MPKAVRRTACCSACRTKTPLVQQQTRAAGANRRPSSQTSTGSFGVSSSSQRLQVADERLNRPQAPRHSPRICEPISFRDSYVLSVPVPCTGCVDNLPKQQPIWIAVPCSKTQKTVHGRRVTSIRQLQRRKQDIVDTPF